MSKVFYFVNHPNCITVKGGARDREDVLNEIKYVRSNAHSKGHSAEEAFQRTEQLALLGEELGYHRMWLAEHHNSQSLASSAPEVTAAFLAAKTKRLRIGTGGVMMMHYSPYKLAEVFKTLSGLAPNRIDFGVGRAPGAIMQLFMHWQREDDNASRNSMISSKSY